MSRIGECPVCKTKNRIRENKSGKPVCGKCRAILPPSASGPIAHLNEDTFDPFITQAAKPVLVDFWAGWCLPCRALAPVLEKFGIRQLKITVTKVNTDHNPKLASRFDVCTIPTLILFDRGREIKRLQGAMSLAELENQLRVWL